MQRLKRKPNLRAPQAALLLGVLAVLLPAARAQQHAGGPDDVAASLDLPSAPEPQAPAAGPTAKPNPCVKKDGRPAYPDSPPERRWVHPAAIPCTTKPLRGYERFVNGPQDKPLTPKDKAWLAARNTADPFNLITIAGEAGISIASDSHSPYGPGMLGYGKYVGVSFTQDITGEFFGTFLIPSLVHQDPHYHRMEGRSIPRRALHAMAQVLWTDGDNGKGMPNYSNLVGFAIDDEISNLYVPGRRTDVPSSAERYATGLASAPIGNFINEFLPDVASHIHVQIVILQRVINQVARTDASASMSQ